MSNIEPSKSISHIKAGLILSSAIILLSVLIAFTGGGDPKGGWISYLIIIVGITFFVQHHGKSMDYRLSFGELFSYGFKTTTIITLVFVLYLVALSFMAPQLKENVMEATRVQLEAQKSLSDSDIDQAMQLTDRYFWVVLIGTSLFFFVFIGAIGSLIGAAITKKTPANPFEQNTAE